MPIGLSTAVADHGIVTFVPLQRDTEDGGLPSMLREEVELTFSGRMHSKTVATLNIPTGLIFLGPSLRILVHVNPLAPSILR